MTIGTKSVLFGVHCFFIHPWFVALGWWKLYGFPWQPWLWVAFFVHDLGYWGRMDMDGRDGERHPILGARIMLWLEYRWRTVAGGRFNGKWCNEVLLHSRFMAANNKRTPSNLCWADKLAMSLEPWWFYLARAKLTGEIAHFRYAQHTGRRDGYKSATTDAEWVKDTQKWCRKVALERIHAPT